MPTLVRFRPETTLQREANSKDKWWCIVWQGDRNLRLRYGLEKTTILIERSQVVEWHYTKRY